MKVAIYTRVSTQDQEPERQLNELRGYVTAEYPEATVNEYVEVVSGTVEGGGEEYKNLKTDVEKGEIDLVVVHELSRLSRLGGGEIHEFIQHCLEHDTGTHDLEVGLSIDPNDSAVDRAVTGMIAGIMGDLARIEQKQKIRRIRSGIESAKEAGKWTGRPPKGFTVDDGYLRVVPEEFLQVQHALERVAAGEAYSTVAEDTGLNEVTLRKLWDNRKELYLTGHAGDERIDAALEEIRPLDVDVDDLEPKTVEELIDEKLDERLSNHC